MVEYLSSELDAVFHALSDPTRRAMLHRLSAGERSVSQLAQPFDMSLAGASKHVKVLEGAGLVSRRVEGRTHYCRLEAARLAGAQAWFRYYERFWTNRIDTLQAILEAEDRERAIRKDSQGKPPVTGT
ncbi:ArsR/SmtB family transcription factor [Nitratireductor kimnyeongensis]|uniref:ArsR/SmtB family transcription factor n=1 Tax=Nitratireductor kimnyeongensis TaxID=430679 RepID=A0ABW0TCP6_9HYPH|nr:metalloregulator ArsR/SmtB family transcription factor [Nitratireductor kimnyeongensis]QZZ37188.1 metalloregulator ArsR/SmtB family transcription factor [Nitratireductor kimnyeongensis]